MLPAQKLGLSIRIVELSPKVVNGNGSKYSECEGEVQQRGCVVEMQALM